MLIFSKIGRYIINRLLRLYFKIKRIFIPIKYPNNPEGKVFIHLGCGEINSPEFINVDSRFFPHVHHIGDVRSLHYFENNFADLIYTSHTLEHIPMEEVKSVLIEWHRVLKPGGVLRISVPDFDNIVSIYKDNDNSIEAIWKPLMGGQEYNENSHYAVFNYSYLEKLLLECGFSETHPWNPEDVENHQFTDWASSDFIINNKKYPISLNIEATK